jgi:hypothetical protein
MGGEPERSVMPEAGTLLAEDAELVRGPHPVGAIGATSVFGGVGDSCGIVPQHVSVYCIPEGGS